MDFVRHNPDLAAEWDALIENSDDGWVFSRSYWLRMMARVWDIEDHSFAVTENGQLAAVLPLHFIPAEKRLSSSGWGYGGPAIAAGLSAADRQRLWLAVFEHVHEIAAQVGATRVTASISPLTRTSLANRWGVNPLVAARFSDVSTVALVVDLSLTEEQLWLGLSSNARQNVKRARAAGYRAERRPWTDMLDTYYRLHRETYERTGARQHPRSYFECIADPANADRHTVLWVGYDPQGRAVAFHNDACFGRTAMYHTGCSAAAHLDSGVNYLLFWEALAGARAGGCLWYESGEVFPRAQGGKEEGLTRFKRKFGGEMHRVFRGELELELAAVRPAGTAPAAPPAGFRAAVRAWLRATRDLMIPIFGARVTASAQRAFFAVRCAPGRAQTTAVRGAARIRKRCLYPPIPFIRPPWSAAEDGAAERAATVDPELATAEFTAQVRVSLALPPAALVVAVNSGRTALELALKALSARTPGRKKVIIPTYCCRGIFDPILHAGLIPVFADTGADLLMDEGSALRSFGTDVLACLCVHLCGKRLDTRALRAAAHRHGMVIIEDWCQAMAGVDHLPRGSEVAFATYSFGFGKNLSATTGGALVAYDLQKELAAAAAALGVEEAAPALHRYRSYRRLYFDRKPPGAPELAGANDTRARSYEVCLRFNPVDALVTVEQLRKMNTIIAGRQANAEIIRGEFERFPGLFSLQPGGNHVYTKFSVALRTVEMLDRFRAFTDDRGIELENMYVPLHLRDFGAPYGHGPLPVSEALFQRVVNVPVRPDLTAPEVRRIGQAVVAFGRRHT